MKRAPRPLGRHDLASRLAGYSATALAAMAAAPAVHAASTVKNITALTLNGTPSAPLTVSFNSSFASDNIGIVALGAAFHLPGVFNSNTGSVGVHGNANMKFSTQAFKLNLGSNLAGRNFGSGHEILAKYTQRSSIRSGDFFPFGGAAHVTGYLAFEGKNSGKTYIGWLHVQVNATQRGDFASQFVLLAKDGDPTIFGAYDLAANVGTDAFTAGSIAAVPEPSSLALGGLGLLALGAAGVREMRRRRQVKSL